MQPGVKYQGVAPVSLSSIFRPSQVPANVVRILFVDNKLFSFTVSLTNPPPPTLKFQSKVTKMMGPFGLLGTAPGTSSPALNPVLRHAAIVQKPFT